MSSLLNKRANDSQTSVDSSRGSEAVLISAAFADSPLAESLHHHSDNDLLGLSKRAAGPGSVQSDMTDEGSTGSRLAGRPAAGWKGRMSSMLLRNPSTSLKADSIKAKKVLLPAHGIACIAWSHEPSLTQITGCGQEDAVSGLESGLRPGINLLDQFAFCSQGVQVISCFQTCSCLHWDSCRPEHEAAQQDVTVLQACV